jgi:adiponectin receptor
VICGLLAGVPLIHVYRFKGTPILPVFDATPYAIGGAIYILGAFLYAMKIPEKYCPGLFDIFVRILQSDSNRDAHINYFIS